MLLSILLEVLAAAVVAWLFRRIRKSWSAARIVFISALPIPLMIWALCAFVFGNAALASKEACGVDACGMAMAAAMFGALGALLLYAIGLVVAAVTVRLAKPTPPESVAAIFE